jgi:predicted MPP superfamily phosphohydrolase
MTRRQFIRLGAVIGATGLLASYPVFIERYCILTNHYIIPVPNLPQAFSGFRIVHLTDLHYGFLVPLAVIRYVIHRASRLNRDLVVCTGDYVHEKGATTQIDAVWPLLSALKAPFGVLSVLGNHDHWADTGRSQEWLNETNQDLRHKTKVIEKGGERLWVAGAGDLWEDHRNLDEILTGIPDSNCRIVLAHNPDTADTEFSGRIDLMISGHTHGGQVAIPFIGPPILPVQNKTYSSGLKTSPRGTRVFISKGIGWAIYPVRFNCAPEIAVLELVPSKAKHHGFEQQSTQRTGPSSASDGR